MPAKKVPKVAIITKSHGRPLLLDRAIKSVEQQTYSDYVHVIFNDGEDQRAVDEIVARYDNPRRVVIHSKDHVGVTKALNQAIQAVDSTYITLLDDDDTWPSQRLKKTIGYLEDTGEKAVVVKMDIIIEEVHGHDIRTISQRPHPESGEGQISLYKQCYKNYLSNGIITYRRDVYDELGGYDETLETAEDWDFGLRLLLKYDVALLDTKEPLFFYHQRPTQAGLLGNEVHARVHNQEVTINKLRNRYLRRELNTGVLGVGYIMNSTVHDMAILTTIKGHMDYTKKLIDESIKHDVHSALTQRNYVYRGVRKVVHTLKKKRP